MEMDETDWKRDEMKERERGDERENETGGK